MKIANNRKAGILFFVLISLNSIAQNTAPTPLYITTLLSDYAPQSRIRFAKKDIGKLKIIYHHEIDPQNTGQVDYALLNKSINSKIPNKKESGICILDWEGPQFEYLKFEKINVDSMNAIIKKFENMLDYARKLRPNAKWGIYDMPITTYWVNQDTSWDARSSIIEPLLKKCDILCPSIYDYFRTGSYGWMDDDAYFKINTERSLAFGVKLNKPVIPFMWHRYHDATENVGLSCIDPDEFLYQIRLINNTNVNGTRIAGMIWWQEDQYYLGIKDPRIIKELKGRSNNEYLDEIALQYLELFKDGLRN